METKIFLKFTLLVMILLVTILFIKCGEGQSLEEEVLNNEFYDESNRNTYFKNYFKEYLVKRKLFNSNKVVKPEEIKKIILEILSGSDEEHPIEQVGDALNQLCDYFINIYYKDKKEIRGKEIYNLIDINAIFKRLEQMMGFGEKDKKKEFNLNKDDLL